MEKIQDWKPYQNSFPYLNVESYDFEKEQVHRLPEEMARAYVALPLEQIGNNLTIVMADPENKIHKEVLKKRLDVEDLLVFRGEFNQIIEAINKNY